MPPTNKARIAALAAIICCTVVKRKKRNARKCWTRDWIKRREEGRGLLSLVENELRLEDQHSYRNFLRMEESSFNKLLDLVGPKIIRQDTNMRQAISPEMRLQVTLRFLATGETYTNLMYATRIPFGTLARIIPETCREIYSSLQEKYMQLLADEDNSLIPRTCQELPTCLMCWDLCGKRSLLYKLCDNNLVCLPGCLQACSFYGIARERLRQKREVLNLQSTAQSVKNIEPWINSEQEVPFMYIIYGKMAAMNRTTQKPIKDLEHPFTFLNNATEINIIGMNSNSSISKVLCVRSNNSHICKHMDRQKLPEKMRTMKQRSRSSKMLVFNKKNDATQLADVQLHKLFQVSQGNITSSTREFSSASRNNPTSPYIIQSLTSLLLVRLFL